MSYSRGKAYRRILVWKKTGGRCAHCGKKASSKNQTIDHFIPKSEFGTYDLRNLMPLCYACNHDRGSRVIDPYKYYSFAPKSIINDCVAYKKDRSGQIY